MKNVLFEKHSNISNDIQNPLLWILIFNIIIYLMYLNKNPFSISKMCPNKILIEILCMKSVAQEMYIFLCRLFVLIFILESMISICYLFKKFFLENHKWYIDGTFLFIYIYIIRNCIRLNIPHTIVPIIHISLQSSFTFQPYLFFTKHSNMRGFSFTFLYFTQLNRLNQYRLLEYNMTRKQNYLFI